jgi:uncharacterized protein
MAIDGLGVAPAGTSHCSKSSCGGTGDIYLEDYPEIVTDLDWKLVRAMAIGRREFVTLLGATAWPFASATAQGRSRILYLTHSAGYRHEVIPLSAAILQQIGERSGRFELNTTADFSDFTTDTLQHYAAVIFHTSGELPMSDIQKAALLRFVRSGHGFIGVHSATDTFYAWPEYLELIGGYFDGHPWHQTVKIQVADPSNSLVSFLGATLEIQDEIYQFSDFDNRESHVLLRLDETSVDLKRAGVQQRPYRWPLAWTRSYGQGRVFYTALGHEEVVWRDPRYQRLLLNAILWATRL